ncbi:hypothetical protein BgiBS90_006474 [Biomphalaria glabrata]|nr:hypothetical protein BgiBS90_006474 [Biomphalaria glabrata]
MPPVVQLPRVHSPFNYLRIVSRTFAFTFGQECLTDAGTTLPQFPRHLPDQTTHTEKLRCFLTCWTWQ